MILQLTFCKANSEQVASFTKVKLGLEVKLDWAREHPPQTPPPLHTHKSAHNLSAHCSVAITLWHNFTLSSIPVYSELGLQCWAVCFPLPEWNWVKFGQLTLQCCCHPLTQFHSPPSQSIQNRSCNSEQVTSPYQSEIGAGRHTVRLGQGKTNKSAHVLTANIAVLPSPSDTISLSPPPQSIQNQALIYCPCH